MVVTFTGEGEAFKSRSAVSESGEALKSGFILLLLTSDNIGESVNVLKSAEVDTEKHVWS